MNFASMMSPEISLHREWLTGMEGEIHRMLYFP